MRLLVAQINPTIGDLTNNSRLISQALLKGKQQGVDCVIFPEMALTGYPCEDILLSNDFIHEVDIHLQKLVKETVGISALIGLPRSNPLGKEKKLYNSCAIIQNGQLMGFADKILLPTYDVFDEKRYFEPGSEVKVWPLCGEKVGILICEDMWQHGAFVKETHYLRDPVSELKALQPSLIINISASPYHMGKWATREQVVQTVSDSLSCPVLFCNQVGGNDGLLFDGRSFFYKDHTCCDLALSFKEDTLVVDTALKKTPESVKKISRAQELYLALVMGIKDYFRKTGFSKAVLGLSGGIDSAVVACLAKEALGSQSVTALMMPSKYTSKESLRDAASLAKHLGIEYIEISIEQPINYFLASLHPILQNRDQGTTVENIQARIRAVLLMAYANEKKALLLNTGNKSELAMGYCTLYGDMCGSIACLGDVTKGLVYEMAHYINREEEVIPSYIIEREPSAELKEGQKDSDTLPEYPLLDAIINAYLEDNSDPSTIAKELSIAPKIVKEIIDRLHINEYKRRQAPLPLRVTSKAFNPGRKVPIAERFQRP